MRYFFIQKEITRIGKRVAFLAIALLALPTPASSAQAPHQDSCVACHGDIAEETHASIHTRAGISCGSCHGGDPGQTTQELAKAPGTGYIGVPDKKQTAEMCGQCHANVEFMNPYGIRTDQLARYKTSRHGKKLLLEGDKRVAGCSDCHGYHDVLAVSDLNSPAYPLNVPKTCSRCHGNEKIMAHYNLPADIFEKYKTSVHGEALFKKRDLSVANCTSCHGSHGAVPPGVKDIGATCGKCHINEEKFFFKSEHAALAGKGGFSQCVSCHDNHSIQPAASDLYDTACVKCHEPSTKAFARGQQLKELQQDTEKIFASTQAMLRKAASEGIFVEEELASLEEAKTSLIEIAPQQHALKVDRISALSGKVKTVCEEVRSSIDQKRRGLRWRKLILIPLWIFIGIMVTALWVKYKRLKFFNIMRKKKREDGSGK